MCILSHPILYSFYNDFAFSVLRIFINNFSNLYGQQELVYNVHSLLHLPADAMIHGPLDNFSAFPFENHIRLLKSYVHGSTRPAQQIFRRLMERRAFSNWMQHDICDDTLIPCSRPLPNSSHCFIHRHTFYSSSPPNNAVIINRKPAVICSVDNETIFYRVFISLRPLFEHCIPSSHLYIFIGHKLSPKVHSCTKGDITCKCLNFPCQDENVFIPLLHSYSS